METYYQLNDSSVVNYLRTVDSLQHLLTNTTTATEIGDGNLNFVYVISGLKDGMKLVLKQAVPYLRCVGESYSLAKERMYFESQSLQLFSKIAPQHIPHIYHVDNQMSLVVMQYLGSHIIMRKGLIAQSTYPNFVSHITDYLANTLFKTSSLYLTGKEKRNLMKDYIGNDELCKITEDFVFSTPYMRHETNPENAALDAEMNSIENDADFKYNALVLKNKFMNQTDALVHGDLHTGSIMINQNETMVIDSEFAFFGPMGFDIGALIANLILAWVSHFERSKSKTYQAWLLNTTVDVYKQFESKFLSLWVEHANTESGLFLKGFCTAATLEKYQHVYMKQILQDSIGFAGLKMARRILGIAGVADIRDIENPDARARAEKLALNIAKRFVKHGDSIQDIADIIPILEEESSHYEQCYAE